MLRGRIHTHKPLKPLINPSLNLRNHKECEGRQNVDLTSLSLSSFLSLPGGGLWFGDGSKQSASAVDCRRSGQQTQGDHKRIRFEIRFAVRLEIVFVLQYNICHEIRFEIQSEMRTRCPNFIRKPCYNINRFTNQK